MAQYLNLLNVSLIKIQSLWGNDSSVSVEDFPSSHKAALCWVSLWCHGSLTLDQVLCVKVMWFVSALTGISMLSERISNLFSWKSHFLLRARTPNRHHLINLNRDMGLWYSMLTLLYSLPWNVGHYCFMVSCPVSCRKSIMCVHSLNPTLQPVWKRGTTCCDL